MGTIAAFPACGCDLLLHLSHMGSVDPGAAGHRHAALRADRGHDDQGGDGGGGLRAPRHAGRRRGRGEAQHAVRCRGWAHSAPEEGVAHRADGGGRGAVQQHQDARGGQRLGVHA